MADLHEIPGPVQVDGHAADASAGSVDRRGEQFEGVWIREGDGQEMCSISGNTLVWSAMCPGLTTVVTVLSECKIEIELEIDGAYVKHCASLESDAKRGQRLLQWSNGETWVESPGKLWVESPKRGKRLLVWGVPGPDSRRGSASRKKRKGSSGGDATQVPKAPGAPQSPPRSRAPLAAHLRHLALLGQRLASVTSRGAGSGAPVGTDAPQQLKAREERSDGAQPKDEPRGGGKGQG